jgi:cobalt-zinc-cadmium efflux system outer membrane protein
VLKQLLLLSGLILPLSGCAWAVRETTDQTVRDMVEHPFDVSPEGATGTAKPPSGARTSDGAPSDARSGEKTAADPRASGVLLASASSRSRSGDRAALVPEVSTDAQTTAWMESRRESARRDGPLNDAQGRRDDTIPLLRPPQVRRDGPLKDDQVLTAAWTQPQPGLSGPGGPQRKLDLEISPRLPGAEAPRIVVPTEPGAAEREIERIYPELPPLPVEPKVQPGPEGKPYTLAEFQRLAAANSPTLRQAASDVEAARGLLIQAKTYPNPTVQYLVDPSNNNSTAGVQGGAIDQPIITGGKMKLGIAAAQKNLDNALLALRRARSDLSTSVRNAYFTLLVDVETLVVTRALVQFSDDIYRLQVGLQKGAQFAPYEPTALRAQTNMNRLAYRQAIQSYIYDWKALVATLGLPQLPLSEIAGSVDRFIPYFDYDEVRAYAVQNHTDILTARNGVKIAQYNLKLAQVTGVFPDIDVRWSLEKDFALAPFGTYQTLALGLPLPIWNQNKGNIIAAQAALVRAAEESHRVEVTLTNNLAAAYGNYRNNLYSMEYYRRYILPDLVRYYRGIYARRQVDVNAAFGDLVFAQQNLTTNVNTYIGILGSLWTSVVGVADFLQTDDLFQMAKPRELPGLPDLHQMQLPPQWACGHDTLAALCASGAELSGPSTADPGAGSSPAGPTGGVPVGPAGSETGPPPPPAGADGAPAPPSRVVQPPRARADGASRAAYQLVQPPAAPRPASPTDRPPVPPSGPEGDPITWLDRWRATVVDPAAAMNAYFSKVGNRVGQALFGPPAPVTTYVGEEKNHEG